MPPLLALLVALWPRVATALDHRAVAWVARLALAVVFVFAIVDLGNDVAELTG